MLHTDGLIVTLAAALGIALIGGFVATKLRLPAIVGYLLAGVALGPFTPGFVANADIAQELAEIGVILLMFGVGMHFSLRELVAVKRIAIPGAVVQIAVATALGTAVAMTWGWSFGNGLVLGLAISVASTVVLLRALGERGVLSSIHGHVAVGWLIVEDLFTVFALVMLPALAPALGGAASADGNPVLAIVIVLGKVALLTALMLFIGARVIPWFLVQVTYTGSRELFTLAVLALALGIAVIAAVVFGASLALGAFLAGLVIGESDLSHQAAADALPLRDAFAVLFFVSVGMLFNPLFLLAEPLKVLAMLLIVILGKGLTALLIVAALGHPLRTGLTVAAGLAQVGEFSFILAELGNGLDLLPEQGRNLILAAAILSITLNPLVFRAVDPMERRVRRRSRLAALFERGAGKLKDLPEPDHDERRAHAIICGFGGVGRLVAQTLDRRGFSFVVIDQNRHHVEELRQRGASAVYGDAANPVLLEHAGIEQARVLIVAIDDAPATRQIVEHARRLSSRVSIVVHTQSEAERALLADHGVNDVVLGEREVAAEVARYTLRRFGVGGAELQTIVQGLRQRGAEH